jgi:hypothetical protein
MSSPNLPQSMPAARERAVKILGDAFAADAFEMDELESRLSRVYQASTIAELDELVKDVAPALPDRSPVPRAPDAALPAPSRLGSFLSSTRRGGRWTVPARVEVRALMSDFTIDLREAELPPGGCEIAVRAAMASVTILVRPGTAVDIDVQAVLASVEDAAHLTTGVDRRLPAVRITGRAVFASIEVHAPAVVPSLREDESG